MAWENSENLDFPWKYHKYPHIFCPASLVKFGEKWDTLINTPRPISKGLWQCQMALVKYFGNSSWGIWYRPRHFKMPQTISNPPLTVSYFSHIALLPHIARAISYKVYLHVSWNYTFKISSRHHVVVKLDQLNGTRQLASTMVALQAWLAIVNTYFFLLSLSPSSPCTFGYFFCFLQPVFGSSYLDQP